jgi:hypothetical protein
VTGKTIFHFFFGHHRVTIALHSNHTYASSQKFKNLHYCWLSSSSRQLPWFNEFPWFPKNRFLVLDHNLLCRFLFFIFRPGLLCSPGWPQTLDPSAFASWVLRLQLWITMPASLSLITIMKINISKLIWCMQKSKQHCYLYKARKLKVLCISKYHMHGGVPLAVSRLRSNAGWILVPSTIIAGGQLSWNLWKDKI